MISTTAAPEITLSIAAQAMLSAEDPDLDEEVDEAEPDALDPEDDPDEAVAVPDAGVAESEAFPPDIEPPVLMPTDSTIG